MCSRSLFVVAQQLTVGLLVAAAAGSLLWLYEIKTSQFDGSFSLKTLTEKLIKISLLSGVKMVIKQVRVVCFETLKSLAERVVVSLFFYGSSSGWTHSRSPSAGRQT